VAAGVEPVGERDHASRHDFGTGDGRHGGARDQAGRDRFLEKQLSTDKLLLTVDNALKPRRLEGENHNLRAIAPGEELLLDYHFAKDSRPVPCYCGVPACRGTINVKAALDLSSGYLLR
jgi:hypothetical protein